MYLLSQLTNKKACQRRLDRIVANYRYEYLCRILLNDDFLQKTKSRLYRLLYRKELLFIDQIKSSLMFNELSGLVVACYCSEHINAHTQ
jgi:hypothetical protein